MKKKRNSGSFSESSQHNSGAVFRKFGEFSAKPYMNSFSSKKAKFRHSFQASFLQSFEQSLLCMPSSRGDEQFSPCSSLSLSRAAGWSAVSCHLPAVMAIGTVLPQSIGKTSTRSAGPGPALQSDPQPHTHTIQTYNFPIACHANTNHWYLMPSVCSRRADLAGWSNPS